MNLDQFILFALLGAILVCLLWGRFRYDLVAFAGLLTGVILGVIPQDQAFSGFSNPAVFIVALVLIASKAFENSGVLALVMRRMSSTNRSITAHIALTGGIAGSLSAVINNVAALALLMPLDIATARKAMRAPAVTLMPLAFATILGGMVTLIGTPSNIIASAIRAERLGAPYGMFSFAPVGLAVAVAGFAFIALIGWRLVPRREDKSAALLRDASFKAEVIVPESSPFCGRIVAELDEAAESADVIILGVIRGAARSYARARAMALQPGDLLIIEGSGEAIATFLKAAGLSERAEPSPEAKEITNNADGDQIASNDEKELPSAHRPQIVEAAVPYNSRLVGRSARSFDLRRRFGLTLIGIARGPSISHSQVRDRTIDAGDVLLLAGPNSTISTSLSAFGLIPINRVEVAAPKPRHIAITVALFFGALFVASTGFLSFAVALAVAVAGYAAFGIVPARELYSQIDWPVIVMLACLLPIGAAFDANGGTALIAKWISLLNSGSDPIVALIMVMVITMTLSDVLNNVATIVIMGPVAIELANTVGANPDAFLMSTAIAASCAFLTPIGHKNNTLIMGPAGLRFGDYWRLGICLEIIVLAVGIPMLLIVWPL
ncbi:MAG: SLC13 family permease [Rhodospirillaceae bacterium]